MTTRREGALLAILCGAIVLESLDFSMVGVALPTIRNDLALDDATAQWVLSAYVLTYGGFMLLGGRVADTFGRRRVFTGSLCGLALCSLAAALATSGLMLALSRAAAGLCAAFLTPASIAIITTSFPAGARRNRALLIYGAAGAAGFSLGLALGGGLATLSWRLVFMLPAIACAAMLFFAPSLIPLDRVTAKKHHFDVRGAVLLTTAMLLCVATIVRSPDARAATTFAGLVATVTLVATFVVLQRRTPEPLLPARVVASGRLVRASLGALCFVGAFAAFEYLMVLYLHDVRGWSPAKTGAALLLVGVDALLAPFLTPPLVERFGSHRVVVTGMVTAVAAYGLLFAVDERWQALHLAPLMFLVGLAFALAYGTLTIEATIEADASDQGLAGAVLQASIQFGVAALVAIATATLAAAGGSLSVASYQRAFLVPVVTACLGLAVFLPRRHNSTSTPA